MAQSHIKLTGGVGDGSRIANSITQSSHGFVVGQAIRYNRLAATGVGSNKYVLAKADEPQNSEVIGVVSSVVGADNFTVTYSGEVDISTFASGFTLADDDVFFLSDTTEGLLTKTPPTAAGAVIKPVLVRTAANTGVITNYVGTVIGGTSVVSLDGIQPVGTIEPYAGSSADIPNTWSLCDGGGLDVADYPDLYTRLGKTFGYYVKVNATIPSTVLVGHYVEARSGGGTSFQTSGIVTEKTDNYVIVEINHLHTESDVLRPHNIEFGSGLNPSLVVPVSVNTSHSGTISTTVSQPSSDITVTIDSVTIEKLRKPDLRGKFILGQAAAGAALTAVDLPSNITSIHRGEFGGEYTTTNIGGDGNFATSGSSGIPNVPPYQAMNWIIKITPRAKAALLDNLTAAFKLSDLADVNAPEISASSGDILIYDALSPDGAKYRPYRLFTDYPDSAENTIQIVMDAGLPRFKIGNTALTQGFAVDLNGLSQETFRIENQGNVGVDVKTSDDGTNLSVGVGIAASTNASLHIGSKGLRFHNDNDVIQNVQRTVRAAGSASDTQIVTEQGIREAIDSVEIGPTAYTSNSGTQIGADDYRTFTNYDIGTPPGQAFSNNYTYKVNSTAISSTQTGGSSFAGRKILLFLGLRVYNFQNEMSKVIVRARAITGGAPTLGEDDIKFITLDRADGDGRAANSIMVPIYYEVPASGTPWLSVEWKGYGQGGIDTTRSPRICSYQILDLGAI